MSIFDPHGDRQPGFTLELSGADRSLTRLGDYQHALTYHMDDIRALATAQADTTAAASRAREADGLPSGGPYFMADPASHSHQSNPGEDGLDDGELRVPVVALQPRPLAEPIFSADKHLAAAQGTANGDAQVDGANQAGQPTSLWGRIATTLRSGGAKPENATTPPVGSTNHGAAVASVEATELAPAESADANEEPAVEVAPPVAAPDEAPAVTGYVSKYPHVTPRTISPIGTRLDTEEMGGESLNGGPADDSDYFDEHDEVRPSGLAGVRHAVSAFVEGRLLGHLLSHLEHHQLDPKSGTLVRKPVAPPDAPPAATVPEPPAQTPVVPILSPAPETTPASKVEPSAVARLFASEEEYRRAVKEHHPLVARLGDFLRLQADVERIYAPMLIDVYHTYLGACRDLTQGEIGLLHPIYLDTRDFWTNRYLEALGKVDRARLMTEYQLARNGIAMTGFPGNISEGEAVFTDQQVAEAIEQAYEVGHTASREDFYTRQHEALPEAEAWSGSAHDAVLALADTMRYHDQLDRQVRLRHEQRVQAINTWYEEAVRRQEVATNLQLSSIFVAEPLATAEEYQAAEARLRAPILAAHQDATAKLKEDYDLEVAIVGNMRWDELNDVDAARELALARVDASLVSMHRQAILQQEEEAERNVPRAGLVMDEPAVKKSITATPDEDGLVESEIYWRHVDLRQQEAQRASDRIVEDRRWLENYAVHTLLPSYERQLQLRAPDHDHSLAALRLRFQYTQRIIDVWDAIQYLVERDDDQLDQVTYSPDAIDAMARRDALAELHPPMTVRARRFLAELATYAREDLATLKLPHDVAKATDEALKSL